MRLLRDAIIISLIVNALTWAFDHRLTLLWAAAVLAGTWLTLRLLAWFIPGFVRGFKRGWRETFHPDEADRQGLTRRLAADMRQVVERRGLAQDGHEAVD